MLELPELTPEAFEILVVRELRKAGLAVSDLRIHRRTSWPEPERGYLLELSGAVHRPPWHASVLIACLRRDAAIGPADLTSVRAHVREARVAAGIVFCTAGFDAAALVAAAEDPLVLLRVVDGRTAFDTSGWGTPGHYPTWLPAYCAQLVERDGSGGVRYPLLESRQGDAIVQQLGRDRSSPDASSRRAVAPGDGATERP
jgi:restriction endonuclease